MEVELSKDSDSNVLEISSLRQSQTAPILPSFFVVAESSTVGHMAPEMPNHRTEGKHGLLRGGGGTQVVDAW